MRVGHLRRPFAADQTPGGHLEFGVREAEEETGVRIKNVSFRAITNDIFTESGKHYITLWMQRCRSRSFCNLLAGNAYTPFR